MKRVSKKSECDMTGKCVLPGTLFSNELDCVVLLQYFAAVVTWSCASITGRLNYRKQKQDQFITRRRVRCADKKGKCIATS